MVQDEQITFRLSADMKQRIDALIPEIEKDPELAVLGTITRSKVVRLAILRGLGALEEQHRAAGKGPRKARPERSRGAAAGRRSAKAS